MAIMMVDLSSNRTEVALNFPASGMKRGARLVAHIVFPTCLTDSVCLLISGGRRTEFGESIFTRSAIVALSSRESVIMSTSSLVPREVPEKPLITVSPDLLETTVGIRRMERVHVILTPIRHQMLWLLSMSMRSVEESVYHLFKGWSASFVICLVI